MDKSPQFSAELLRRYNQPVPRYTSYPTAPRFSEAVSVPDWERAVASRGNNASPWSLYFHIPFCRSLCFYCACNKIITPTQSRSFPYLEHLFRELKLVSSKLNKQNRKVSQIHLGGGTPTFLTPQQLTDLWDQINRHFILEADGEYGIEIDPRAANTNTIKHLTELGFNRMSFGIQDFDPEVQKAVNRIQSVKDTFDQINTARANGVRSINVDLIYGLPLQTIQSFSRTLETVIAERPDRIAVYGYAHLPQLFRAQRQIDKHYLPPEKEKLALLELAITKFIGAGYEYVGMDHFALPEDELAKARRDGSLQRNFQGYSTRQECDMLGFGITSIGKVGNLYYQNTKYEKEYFSYLGGERLPITKGYQLTEDDRLRRTIIMTLMCQGKLDLEAFEVETGLSFFRYFDREIPDLLRLAEDKLIELNDRQIVITRRGQLLLRNICHKFDAYRGIPGEQRIHTRAI
ncbi:MAG: oxygen-independent coproporphyrinogen III oxidase [Ketobacteraceae bacterium]|nr:oxygen-independent coproporphyrinogen III oxidase [Ketobacteraceae bacterium]